MFMKPENGKRIKSIEKDSSVAFFSFRPSLYYTKYSFCIVEYIVNTTALLSDRWEIFSHWLLNRGLCAKLTHVDLLLFKILLCVL